MKIWYVPIIERDMLKTFLVTSEYALCKFVPLLCIFIVFTSAFRCIFIVFTSAFHCIFIVFTGAFHCLFIVFTGAFHYIYCFHRSFSLYIYCFHRRFSLNIYCFHRRFSLYIYYFHRRFSLYIYRMSLFGLEHSGVLPILYSPYKNALPCPSDDFKYTFGGGCPSRDCLLNKHSCQNVTQTSRYCFPSGKDRWAAQNTDCSYILWLCLWSVYRTS